MRGVCEQLVDLPLRRREERVAFENVIVGSGSRRVNSYQHLGGGDYPGHSALLFFPARLVDES